MVDGANPSCPTNTKHKGVKVKKINLGKDQTLFYISEKDTQSSVDLFGYTTSVAYTTGLCDMVKLVEFRTKSLFLALLPR